MNRITPEFKKLFSSAFTWVCLIAVIAFMGYYVYKAFSVSMYQEDFSRDTYRNIIAEYRAKGLSDQELLEQLSAENSQLTEQAIAYGDDDDIYSMPGKYGKNPIDDFLSLNRACDYARYLFDDLPSHRRVIVTDALYNIRAEQAKSEPDLYIISENQLAADMYNRIVPTEFTDPGDVDRTLEYFDNTIWDYIMAAFAVLLTVRMFTLDITRRSYKMIFSSANGRGRLFLSQMSVCLIVFTAMILIQTLCQLICGIVFFGVENFSLPVQNVESFELCPFNLTLGGYFALKTIGKLLFYYMTATFAAMLCALIRKPLPCAAVSLTAAILPLAAAGYIHELTLGENILSAEYKIFEALRCFVPHCLLDPETYFTSFDHINIAGLEISRFVFVVIITAIITAGCFVLAYLKFGKSTAKQRG